MRWMISVAVFASTSVLALLILNPVASATLSRSSGDFWEYDLTTEFAGLEVSGTIVYSYDGQASVTVGGSEHSVDVLRLSGNFSYSDDEVVPVRIAGLISGYAYETVGGTGLVLETVTMLATQYSGSPPAQFETPLSLYVSSSFSPPRYVDLSSDELDAGDVWSVATTSSVTTNWTRGTETFDSLEESTTTYVHSVDSVRETLTTPAGSFTTTIVTVTHPGGREVMWFSQDAGGFVRTERFNGTGASPVETLVLSSYSYDEGEDRLVVIVAVLLVVATAVLILMLVMAILRSGRSQASTPEESEALSADAKFNPPDDDGPEWSRGPPKGKR